MRWIMRSLFSSFMALDSASLVCWNVCAHSNREPFPSQFLLRYSKVIASSWSTVSPPFPRPNSTTTRRRGQAQSEMKGGDAYQFLHSGPAHGARADAGAAGQGAGPEKPEHRCHVGERPPQCAQHDSPAAGGSSGVQHRRTLRPRPAWPGQRMKEIL